MKNRLSKTILILVVLVLLPVSMLSAKAVEFSANDIDGKTITSDIFKDSKLTMVNIWATYCNPCLSEMPFLAQIAKERDPKEFQMIGIISDVPENISSKDRDIIKDFLDTVGSEYPHLLLNQSLYNSIVAGTMAVPTTLFIDSNGEVVASVIGSNSKAKWDKKINEVLKKL